MMATTMTLVMMMMMMMNIRTKVRLDGYETYHIYVASTTLKLATPDKKFIVSSPRNTEAKSRTLKVIPSRGAMLYMFVPTLLESPGTPILCVPLCSVCASAHDCRLGAAGIRQPDILRTQMTMRTNQKQNKES